MPWGLVASLLISLVKYVAQKIFKKKMTDLEFLRFIEAHQNRRSGAGKTAKDFSKAMEKARAELKKQKEEKK